MFESLFFLILYYIKCTPSFSLFFFLSLSLSQGRCTDPNDIKTCSTTANIGFAAVEEGVCYPAHQHMAEEGYWQIAGRGWWRTWCTYLYVAVAVAVATAVIVDLYHLLLVH